MKRKRHEFFTLLTLFRKTEKEVHLAIDFETLAIMIPTTCLNITREKTNLITTQDKRTKTTDNMPELGLKFQNSNPKSICPFEYLKTRRGLRKTRLEQQ